MIKYNFLSNKVIEYIPYIASNKVDFDSMLLLIWFENDELYVETIELDLTVSGFLCKLFITHFII